MARALHVPRRGRVSDAIAARIKKDISNGDLVPGAKLPAERELARRFKTSRLSVREAYRSLQELGMLSIRRGAGGGAFIAEIDHQPVARSLALMLRLGNVSHEELTEARLLLEPPVARLAARRASPEDVARLEDLLHRQEAALSRREGPRRLALEFHRLVARSARNLPLEIVMNALADFAVEAIAHIDMSVNVHRHVVTFHRKILSAIRRHKEEAAYDLMRRHVSEVQSRLGKDLIDQVRGRRGASRRPRTKKARPRG
jgi:GntR family transcriptional repressor for pyruvate dehydrogenase complex